MYLEGIFGGSDISKQLPEQAKFFDNIDKKFKKVKLILEFNSVNFFYFMHYVQNVGKMADQIYILFFFLDLMIWKTVKFFSLILKDSFIPVCFERLSLYWSISVLFSPEYFYPRMHYIVLLLKVFMTSKSRSVTLPILHEIYSLLNASIVINSSCICYSGCSRFSVSVARSSDNNTDQ